MTSDDRLKDNLLKAQNNRTFVFVHNFFRGMVFEDPTRKRWRYTVSTFVSIVVIFAAILGISVAGIIFIPELPIYDAQAEQQITEIPLSDLPVVQAIPPDMTETWRQQQNTSAPTDLAPKLQTVIKMVEPKHYKLVSANILQSDTNSLKSLETNADKIDIGIPDWFTIKQASCNPDVSINDNITQILKDNRIAIVPRLSNSDGLTIYQQEFQTLLHSSDLRSCMINNVIQTLKANQANGLILDMDSLSLQESDNYLRLISEFAAALHNDGLWLEVVIPAGNRSYNVGVINDYADLVVIGLNGEHYAGSESGPIASQDWFEKAFTYFQEITSAQKMLVGMGSYAYDWNLNDASSTAQSLTYGQAIALARQAKILPTLEESSLNTLFGYRDSDNSVHAVWLLDSLALWNEWQTVRDTDIAGISLWRLGSEDQTFWNFAGSHSATYDSVSSPLALSTIAINGKPEVYRLARTPMNGRIEISSNDQGLITKAQYQQLPSGYELAAVSRTNQNRRLMLIIDGGPDPEWTPKILEELAKNKISATFFVTTPESEKYPWLLKSIADQGHLVGNRGSIYENQDNITKQELIDSINNTQRVIQRELLAGTRLYLRQYHSFALPANLQDAEHIKDVSEMGLFIVRANIDAKDWVAGTTAEKIIENVRAGLTQAGNGTHVIAFQGDGDDRKQTVEAMQTLLPEIIGQGYEFYSMDKALGLNRIDLMPTLKDDQAIFARSTQVVANMANMVWPMIQALFLITTIFSLIRIVTMYYFAVRSVRRKRPRGNPKKRNVSVLVPAYNEEQTIAKTLRALQNSQHRRFEALVINDGSTDRTAEIVESIAAQDHRIKLINKENGGKSSALNLGMRLARYDIVVTIDGDTILQPQAIDELVSPFFNKNVDAVCGNVEVGNVCNTLTAFQALEYITAQNFDRNALEEVNAINVVPGATGAWKRKKVLQIGGYESDTLTEDADLTIKMLAAGGKIAYAHNARSLTEAPQTLSALSKQRFRWSFGTFQCLGKHYKLFFKGRVGWIPLPNIFVFQIIFPLLAPIGDIVFILTLLSGSYGIIFWSYLFFTGMELVSSSYAFIIDKKPKRLLLMAFVQRFYYRQFLYITIIRAIIATLKGKRYGWNKLERLGTVIEAT